jgi:rRNA maturation endonuclease Nob1
MSNIYEYTKSYQYSIQNYKIPVFCLSCDIKFDSSNHDSCPICGETEYQSLKKKKRY